MLSPIDVKERPLVKSTCIQVFEFSANPPECGKPAAFLVKNIFEPTYSIMCSECKSDFFGDIAFQSVVKDYRSYEYSAELNEKFAAELEQYLVEAKKLETEAEN